MTIRACILATLCVAAMSAGAATAPPAAAPKKTTADSTVVKRPGTQASKPASAAQGGIRTIDAINIEGEIAVPQVLFITSRDNRRYRDGLGKNFRLGTLDVARDLTAPKRLCVAGQSGSEPKSLKEE
jgi:hypothetical protein